MIKDIIRSSNYWNLSKPLVKKLGIETAFLLTNLVEAEHMMKTKDGWFFQTIEKLEELTTLSRHKQEKSINELQEIGLVDVVVKGLPAKRYFKINEDVLQEILFAKDSQPSLRKIDKLECEKLATSKESTYKENNNKEIVEIVNYLNDVATKKFKHTTNKTKTLINARLKENFTVDDFKTVIDKKTKDWKQNDKMNRYLRPETLFGTKFESYLNEISKNGVDRKVADF